LHPFQAGTGLLAVEARVPVVPMWIEVDRQSRVQGPHWPWRGAFTVYLGEPLTFAPGTPYGEATARIGSAVRALGGEARLRSPTGGVESTVEPETASASSRSKAGSR
jgi:1-acyl-sn-glycerol-3-phosphate acyltransferase